MEAQRLFLAKKKTEEEGKLGKAGAWQEQNQREIQALRAEVKSLYSKLDEEVREAMKELPAQLWEDPQLKFAAQRLQPQELLEKLEQLNFNETRQRDRLKHGWDKCLATIKEIQYASAQEEADEDILSYLSKQREKYLVLNIHKTAMKTNVANTVNCIYESILDVLKKDMLHMGTSLEELSQEHHALCKDILTATEKSQFLQEQQVQLRGRQQALETQEATDRARQDHALADMKARIALASEQNWHCIVTRLPEEGYMGQRREQLPTRDYMELLKKLDELENVLHELSTEGRLTDYQPVFLRIEDPFRSKCNVDTQIQFQQQDLEPWLFAKVDSLMEDGASDRAAEAACFMFDQYGETALSILTILTIRISAEEVTKEELPGAPVATAAAEQRQLVELLPYLARLCNVLQEARPFTEVVLHEANEMVHTLMTVLDAAD